MLMKKLILPTIIAAATAGTLFAFFQPKAELSAAQRQNVEALSSDEEPDILDKICNTYCTPSPNTTCLVSYGDAKLTCPNAFNISRSSKFTTH